MFIYSQLDQLMEEEIQLVQCTGNGRQVPKTIEQRLYHLFAYNGQETNLPEEKMERKWDKKLYRLRYKTGVEIWNHHLKQFNSSFLWSNVEFFKYFVRRCTLWPNSTTQKWFPLKYMPGRSDLGKRYVWCGLNYSGHRAFFPKTWKLTNDPRLLFTQAVPLNNTWLTLEVDKVRGIIEDCKGEILSWRDLSAEYAWDWIQVPGYLPDTTSIVVLDNNDVEDSIMEPMWSHYGKSA